MTPTAQHSRHIHTTTSSKRKVVLVFKSRRLEELLIPPRLLPTYSIVNFGSTTRIFSLARNCFGKQKLYSFSPRRRPCSVDVRLQLLPISSITDSGESCAFIFPKEISFARPWRWTRCMNKKGYREPSDVAASALLRLIIAANNLDDMTRIDSFE